MGHAKMQTGLRVVDLPAGELVRPQRLQSQLQQQDRAPASLGRRSFIVGSSGPGIGNN